MKTHEKTYKTIGQGTRASWPYKVAVCWKHDDSYSGGPIALSEGSGHGAAGGLFALQDLLQDTWTNHLEICGCSWLRELAREEMGRKTLFSADEIWARAKEHLDL